MSGKRITEPTRQVLHALLDHPDTERYGLDLAKQAAIAHGTMYGILVRLEGWGWVESRVDHPVDRATPPRRYYRLTPDGAARAEAALTSAACGRSRRANDAHPHPGYAQ